MLQYFPNITGSLQVTGSVLVSGSITATAGITISGSIDSASYAANADKLDNLDSTAFVFTSSYNPDSSSLSSRVTKIEGNYATTGSNVFMGAQTVCANITSTGTIIAQTLNVQQVTSSIVYSSGSNTFGCALTDVQQLTGSVRITGSLNVAGNTCVTSICSPAYVGGTVSGTTIYGSTAICGAVICGGATTLTGALCGTSATFSGDVNTTNGSLTIKTAAFGGLLNLESGTSTSKWLLYHYSPDNTLRFNYNGTGGDELTIASTGAATFSAGVTIKSGNGDQLLLNNAGERFTQINFSNNTVSKANIWWDNTNTELVLLANSSGTGHLKIASTGAATFSSSVTANGIIQAALPSGLPATFELYDSGGGTNLKYWRIESRSTDASYKYFNVSSFNDALNSLAYGMRIRVPAGSITPDQVLFPNGNVGIGITSINYKLDVANNGAASFFGITNQSGASGDRYLRIGFGSGATFASIQGTRINVADDVNLALQPDGGNVYIGATSGDYGKLDVTVSPSSYTAALGLGVRTNSSEGNSVGISFKTKVSLSGAIWENARIAAITTGVTSSAYGELAFYTMNATTLSERMRIAGGGDISITCNVSISGNITLNTGANRILRIGSGTSYYYDLQSVGDNFEIREAGTTTRMKIFYPSGVVCFSSTICAPCFATISDYRMKSNLRPIEGLSIIMNTKPYKFEYNYDCSTSFGMIAHELQEIVPEAVFGVKDGEVMQGVDYMKLLPIAIKAIQELKCENDIFKTCLGII
jgi:hypothetical protein